MLAIHLGAVLSHVHVAAAWVVQEGGGAMATDPLGLWKAMGWVARTVVVILFIMSGWSIGVRIDRWMAYSAARKQSRAFAPAVAGALRDGRIDEAIKVAEDRLLFYVRRYEAKDSKRKAFKPLTYGVLNGRVG